MTEENIDIQGTMVDKTKHRVYNIRTVPVLYSILYSRTGCSAISNLDFIKENSQILILKKKTARS